MYRHAEHQLLVKWLPLEIGENALVKGFSYICNSSLKKVKQIKPLKVYGAGQ